MSEAVRLRVIPLGGLGEIGLNCMLVEYGNDMIMIDCGVLFPDLAWMGLDLVLPDFTYVIENQKKLRGIVVTHGHEDHIGAIPFLLQQMEVPIVYAGRFARRLIQEKCSEHRTVDRLVTHDVRPGDSVDMGSLSVEFIHVTHSTVETFALAIRTPAGLVVHSGDFKFDEHPYAGVPSDKKRLRELSREKPLLLLSDSTNSERPGHCESESSITDELERHIVESRGTVVVALFASNVHRVQQLIDIAGRIGRKVFLSGRSMDRYVQIALEEGHLPVNLSLLQPIEAIDQFQPSERLVLSTGSQGESRSSLLRLAHGENRWLKLQKDDTVIMSSRRIPGNERAVSHVVNQFFKLGVQVIYESNARVHVSGHAHQGEQRELLELVQPQYFIPVHGEYRHLATHRTTACGSGALGQDAYVIENGQVWEYAPDTAEVFTDQVVPVGRRWVFQGQSGDMDSPSMKERRAAARAGVVAVSCLVTSRASKLIERPQVTLKALFYDEKLLSSLQKEVAKQCEEAFESWSATNAEGYTREQAVAAAATRVVRKAVDYKPLVVVHFLENRK